MTLDASSDTKVCPYCAETIQAAAVVCRYCGRDLLPDASASIPSVAMPAGYVTKEVNPTANTLANIGILCGFIGLFVLGFLFGGVAILCGAIAMGSGSERGKTSLIIGILDIAIPLCFLFM